MSYRGDVCRVVGIIEPNHVLYGLSCCSVSQREYEHCECRRLDGLKFTTQGRQFLRGSGWAIAGPNTFFVLNYKARWNLGSPIVAKTVNPIESNRGRD